MAEIKNVVIVGAGVSGLISAYLLKSFSDVSVTIIDKGEKYEERLLDKDPDMLCGVGGAGTLGGGKLCLPPASERIWNKTEFSTDDFQTFWKLCIFPFVNNRIRNTQYAEEISRSFGVYENNIYRKRYGTMLLPKPEMNSFVINLVKKNLELGVRIDTECELKGVAAIKDDKYLAQYYHCGIIQREIADAIIIASGRSSADRISSWLPQNVEIVNQCPDLGLRLSVPRTNGNIFSEVGKDVKIKTQINGIGVRTFCVCSGGDKTLVSTNRIQYYDGHFGEDITPIANLGILARSPKLCGYNYAEEYCSCLKKYANSEMTLSDFVKNWNKLISETSIFDEILYALVCFIKRLQAGGKFPENLDLDQCPVFIPSVDNLSPMVNTNKHFETNCHNLYVIGDACGMSRGFIQSMWSGFCASKNIISKCEYGIEDKRRRNIL